MDGFSWFILVVVAFNIFRAITKAKEGAESVPPPPVKPRVRPPQPTALPKGPPPRPRVERRPSAPAPKPKHPEELWQEMLGQLQQTESARRSGQVRVEEVQGWEETGSLEVEENVRSLEDPVIRAPRKRVDYDDQAEGIARRRVVAAKARDGAITPADHAAFDATVRVPAAAVLALTTGRDDLRRAIVWREVLGPPVSLREE